MACLLHCVLFAVIVLGGTGDIVSAETGNILLKQAESLFAQANAQSLDAVLFWNSVLLRTAANDYDSLIAASPDQVGPTSTSRAFAIIHGAIYEALNAFERLFPPVFRPSNMPPTGDVLRTPAVEAAVGESAYTTLYNLYPKQRPLFDAARAGFLRKFKKDASTQAALNRGALVGKIIAVTMLDIKASDSYQLNTGYTPINASGYHQVDPTRPSQGYFGPQWGNVRPFIVSSGSQFRASKVIGENVSARLDYLHSPRYLDDYHEILSLGSRVNSNRTSDQTEIGIFWAYDGAPKIGVPPRLYNQIVHVVAIGKKNTIQQNARLFALVNYAMADAGITSWETKYYYNFWRPIVAIRRGTDIMPGIPGWQPLGSPADGVGNNFTPGFPSYVSGHSTFGSATFETLRLFYGTDQVSFRFKSDEYNGRTVDSITGDVRPTRTRSYRSFTEAETENYLSRIYLGVHWRLDQEEGQTMGRKIAGFVFNKIS